VRLRRLRGLREQGGGKKQSGEDLHTGFDEPSR
jgi:hypothetical protein